MDLTQTKLTRAEWNNIEIPVSQEEIHILKLIQSGYHNTSIIENDLVSILEYLKISPTDAIETYLFTTYFQSMTTYTVPPEKCVLKKADRIRLESSKQMNKKEIYEFILLDLVIQMKKATTKEKKHYYFYTLYELFGLHIPRNKHVNTYVKNELDSFTYDLPFMVENSCRILEQNAYTYKYQDRKLYDHQKQLFTVAKSSYPKLILYTAPTGCGKTLSPLGLSEQYKIIFICAARHVGLAFARAAISVHKKIAFAFGCNDPGDVKLHYFSVKDCKRDKRNGRILKVDNSVGDNVEIMICDLHSYIHAMRYMFAFEDDPSKFILYWDEPTITLDYENHPLHETIHQIWKNNEIPNVVLSSATLPKEQELQPMIQDMRSRFIHCQVTSINTHDANKTICVMNIDNQIELPHYYCKTREELLVCIQYILDHRTLLRYMDLGEILRFLSMVNLPIMMEDYFAELNDYTIPNIKLYYLMVLKRIDKWETIYIEECKRRTTLFASTLRVTTDDAWTLTDGPTIYLTSLIQTVGNFCLKTANIPPSLMKDLMINLDYNTQISKKITAMEKDIEDKNMEDQDKEKKMLNERYNPEVKQLQQQIEVLRGQIKNIVLPDVYIPNTQDHKDRYKATNENTFTTTIDTITLEKVMSLDVEEGWKLLMMMGIGVFAPQHSSYMEIMKEMASNQRLYMILADTDYIYGTNYQFCHAYIGKDLETMTQEKLIQAMGRVGRGKLQQTYSVRFRNSYGSTMFLPPTRRPEVDNMRRLFVSM